MRTMRKICAFCFAETYFVNHNVQQFFIFLWTDVIKGMWRDKRYVIWGQTFSAFMKEQATCVESLSSREKTRVMKLMKLRVHFEAIYWVAKNNHRTTEIVFAIPTYTFSTRLSHYWRITNIGFKANRSSIPPDSHPSRIASLARNAPGLAIFCQA